VLRCDGVTATYSMLAAEVARFADYLIDGGVEPGDHVGVMLPNGPAFAVVFYGVLRAGGVMVAMNPELPRGGVRFDGHRHTDLVSRRSTSGIDRPRRGHRRNATRAIGKHGIATLTAGLSGRTEPVIRAGDDIAFTVYAPERRVFQRSPNSPTPRSSAAGPSSPAACWTLAPMTS
jgi:long-chain acyl-CoA synthetase